MNKTNPKDYLELLEVFSIALLNGILDKSEVIKWADEIIINDDEPDYFIIELSLCCHKSIYDIVSIINEYIGIDKPIVSGRVVLGLIYRRYLTGQITLRKVASTINWIAWETDLAYDEKSLMYGFDEYIDLAEEGLYGTVEGVEKEVLRFIEIYKDFQLSNYSEWKMINETIGNKIVQLIETIKHEQDMLVLNQTKQKKKKWWNFWLH
jgi:hypothetical protein